jgi:hypothetical protein
VLAIDNDMQHAILNRAGGSGAPALAQRHAPTAAQRQRAEPRSARPVPAGPAAPAPCNLTEPGGEALGRDRRMGPLCTSRLHQLCHLHRESW